MFFKQIPAALIFTFAALCSVSALATPGNGSKIHPARDNQIFVTDIGLSNFTNNNLIWASGNHNGNGYMLSSLITEGFSSYHWNLPAGSYFCVGEMTRMGVHTFINYFKVLTPTSPSPINHVYLYGSEAKHTWFGMGNAPDLLYLGKKLAPQSAHFSALCAEGV